MSVALSEWGAEGARKFGEFAGALVIVDVLSFSTCVDIAVGRGATVYPVADDCGAAARMARTVGAELAGPRGSREHRFSLSPASLSEIEAGAKLVLPSPNGSAISAAARTVPVLAGCLRNARAVARKAAAIARGSPVAVIPAGERWPDGSLRPAIEDLIGAGAIIEELRLPCSPEAEIARLAFRSARPAIADLLRGCTSGRELIDRGYPHDVEAAIELNVSATAPLLVDGAYTA
ncbi:MAG TPA: 2-phosphosulfolactate phosphatase [Hyphomicrobiales bacterium]|jgi:2-phosphosulfolactate phosphatase